VLGVVHMPATGVTYAAAADRGAWREEGDGRRAPLRCSEADLTHLRLVGSRSHPDPLVTRLAADLGIQDVEPCGSVGVKCARIAEGRRDLYVHPVPYLKEWDTCAPEVILREAGGWVSDCLGEPLRYNQPTPAQPHGILACTPAVARVVLPRLRDLYQAQATTILR
jgi:3'(2'), 5'-bisphosphate nucleotidase